MSQSQVTPPQHRGTLSCNSMLSLEDPRWTLLPEAGSTLYLHKPADQNTDDMVCGPFRSAGSAIERSTLTSIDDTRRRRLVAYEQQTAEESAKVKDQRREVDLRLEYVGSAPDELVRSYHDAVLAVEACIPSIFGGVVCSMMRIVISAYILDAKGWIVATARDREKIPGLSTPLCYLRSNQDRIEWFGDELAPPTSSGSMAVEFHSLVQKPGLLLHTHPVFAVLLDRPVQNSHLLTSAPRSSAFAEEIARAALEHRVAFRPKEGIWAFGGSSADVVGATRTYQAGAVAEILAELSL